MANQKNTVPVKLASDIWKIKTVVLNVENVTLPEVKGFVITAYDAEKMHDKNNALVGSGRLYRKTIRGGDWICEGDFAAKPGWLGNAILEFAQPTPTGGAHYVANIPAEFISKDEFKALFSAPEK